MNIKLHKDGIEWGFFRSPTYPDYTCYLYYFYWWNWLPNKHRYWGFRQLYYDGIHNSLGFWFFNVSWVFPWSKEVKE